MNYEYIKRMYGVNPLINGRVKHHVTGRYGNIAPPSPEHGHYVQVIYDGDEDARNTHPTEIDYLTQETET